MTEKEKLEQEYADRLRNFALLFYKEQSNEALRPLIRQVYEYNREVIKLKMRRFVKTLCVDGKFPKWLES